MHHESDTITGSLMRSRNGRDSEGVQRSDQKQDKDNSGSRREAERENPSNGSAPGDDADAEGGDGLQSMETDNVQVESSSMSLSHHVASGFPPDGNPPKTPDVGNAVHFEVEFNIKQSEDKCMPHQTIRVEGTVQSEVAFLITSQT